MLRIRLVIVVALATVWASCASTSAGDSKCRDYKPLPMCGLDSEFVCSTTPDGCEECTCVSRREIREGIGPLAPRD